MKIVSALRGGALISFLDEDKVLAVWAILGLAFAADVALSQSASVRYFEGAPIRATRASLQWVGMASLWVVCAVAYARMSLGVDGVALCKFALAQTCSAVALAFAQGHAGSMVDRRVKYAGLVVALLLAYASYS